MSTKPGQLHIDEHPGVRYETPMRSALERLDRAVEVLGAVSHPATIPGMVVDLAKWLRPFSSESLVELDYSSVAGLFDADELADDHSAADMWARIRALADGDGARAAALQRVLDERWDAHRALELTN